MSLIDNHKRVLKPIKQQNNLEVKQIKLVEFIKSHDGAILAIERLKNILENEEFIGALECVVDIENHLKLVEIEYLDGMQYLATGEEQTWQKKSVIGG